MKRALKLLSAGFVVVFVLAAIFMVWECRPPNDGRTLAERREIADACLAMLHSSLTNEMEEIKMDDPRIPRVIRNLNPHYIYVIPNFAVDIYREGKPEEYFLMHISTPTNAWILCIAGPSVWRSGGREILRVADN